MSPLGQSPATPVRATETTRGILLMCAALLCFSLLDSSGKWLGPKIGALETTWVRYTISVVLVSLVINPWRTPGVARTRKPLLQMLRSLMLFASTVLNFMALKYLPLMEVLSVLFCTPLVVALLSGPVLGEWVGPRRLVAILIGFGGILIVTRPGIAAFHPAILYSLAGVFAYAFYAILTRILAGYDSSATTMFYSGIAGVVLLTPAIPSIWIAPPDTLSLFVMLGTGIFGAVGHWLLILAHRHAPASTLSPFIYTQMVYVVILGYVIFDNVPDAWTIAGSAVVVGSGLYLLHRERVQGVRP